MLPIDHAHLSRLDLNLLVAFDALMRERHVTRAARRVGLGQPAMSHHLARLRELLGDELFTRAPTGIVPTPHALALAEPVRTALECLQGILTQRPFDPSTQERHFRVSLSDGMESSLMPPFLALAAREAPGVTLSLSPFQEAMGPAMLDDGSLDLIVGPPQDQAPHHKTRLFCSAGYLVLFDPQAVQVDTPLSLEDFLAIPHVRVSRRADSSDAVDDALAKLRLRRRVAVHTAHSLSVPHLLLGSRLLGLLPRRAALATARAFGLSHSPPPLELPLDAIAMRWHASRDSDPGHRWLLEAMFRAATLSVEPGGFMRMAARTPPPRKRSRQKVAMGFTGEPVPPSTARGATLKRKS
ncbi:LysR substrate-binding domain-containing protein [Myxococcus landrumensis]|uniref:LysR family transcriptional regulator n=1 Tax=Myxococcus landrumensis TaxID=2813577 RepID=A0ABX7NBH8_9BACT|nr:LysR substrate-binding domain-containing protein [Myxococcus landrumus]QSQ16139.1 LysR family transcriptional regulator [Myxococcus landrumus]